MPVAMAYAINHKMCCDPFLRFICETQMYEQSLREKSCDCMCLNIPMSMCCTIYVLLFQCLYDQGTSS